MWEMHIYFLEGELTFCQILYHFVIFIFVQSYFCIRDHKVGFLKATSVLSKGQDVWEVTTSDVFGMCPSPSLLLVQVKWFIKFLFIGTFLGHLCILLLVFISVISTVFLYFSCFSDHMSSSLCGSVLPWGSYADSKTGASRACALPASRHAAELLF